MDDTKQDVENDDDEFEFTQINISSQDNTPLWMREINSKEKIFSDRLQRVQEQQKKLVAGLDNFDNKRDEQEKLMRQMKLKKRQEPPKYDHLKLNNKKYHEYYQNKALEQNQANTALKMNKYLMLSIIEYDSDPIILIMKLQRVCKRWNIQLRDDSIWQSLCKQYLGLNFIQQNNEFYIDGYWRLSAQLFRRNWSRAVHFFNQYSKNPQDMKVASVIRECIFVLVFFQQIISLPERSQLIVSLNEQTSKMEFQIKSLYQNSHYIVCEQSQLLYITLQGHHNFKLVKIIFENDILLSTKQIYNQEFRPQMKTFPYLPAFFKYTWVNENIFGFLRDFNLDKLLVSNFDQTYFQIENFLTFEMANSIVYIYDRYNEKNLVQEYIASLKFTKNKVTGKAFSQCSNISLSGQLQITKEKSIQKPNQYEIGTTNFGDGQINIQFGQNNNEIKFKCFLCLGVTSSNQQVSPLIIGNHEGNKLLLILCQ